MNLQMDEFLRDQNILIIIGSLTLVATLVAIWSRRRRRVFAFQVVTESSLIPEVAGLQDEEELLLGDTLASRVHFVKVRFSNEGNVDFKTEDLDQPLTVTLGAEARILRAYVSDTKPSNLSVHLEYAIGENTATCRFSLLNRKESFSVNFLVENYEGKIDPQVRLVGVSRLRRMGERMITDDFVLSSLLIIGWLAILTALSLLPRSTEPRDPYTVLDYIAVAGLFTVMGASALIFSRATFRMIKRTASVFGE